LGVYFTKLISFYSVLQIIKQISFYTVLTEFMKIGERIRNLRQMSNLTQEELAERAGLTKGFISQIERDLTSISLDSLIKILER